jgi:hypothetical protein
MPTALHSRMRVFSAMALRNAWQVFSVSPGGGEIVHESELRKSNSILRPNGGKSMFTRVFNIF